MTAQSSIPLKWYVPFAQGDSSRVELPVTTADPTRASQTLGFPPLTMQPPESGGVPPQGEDFNGGMNQVARICWWILNGGGWPYDSTFATNSNINGYPNGAVLQAADFRGDWINTADNNQNNPDTNGTNWVPGFQYGVTALAGLTGGTVTPTPAQAAKNSITLAGTLGSALTIVLPNWTKNWTITNNTTGAFVTIVKTAAGSGVTIPQNASPTRVSGDGTNIVQGSENIAAATSSTQAMQLGQATGRLLGAPQIFTGAGPFTYTRNTLATFVIVEVQGPGGGSAGAAATGAGQFSGSPGASSGAYAMVLLTAAQVGTSQTVTPQTGGAAGTSGGGAGGNGASATFGSIITCPGGPGSAAYGPTGATLFIQNAPAGASVPTITTGTVIVSTAGNTGGFAIGSAANGVASAQGGAAPLTGSTSSPADFGAGGRGTSVGPSSSAVAGIAGGGGKIIVWEYA